MTYSTAEEIEEGGPGDLGETLALEVGHWRHVLSPTGVQVVAITVVAALMFLFFSIFAPHFVSVSNIYTMAQVSSYTFIVAAGLCAIAAGLIIGAINGLKLGQDYGVALT
jgi:hypothetical protein